MTAFVICKVLPAGQVWLIQAEPLVRWGSASEAARFPNAATAWLVIGTLPVSDRDGAMPLEVD